MTDVKSLQQRIRELEQEIAAKDNELAHYRQELGSVNQSLENLIAQTHQEINLAQSLQKFLSPTELPNISGFDFSTKFIPGSRSGGDYFDIFEHEDKLKFGILLASSSGYGMSALLLSVVIKISSQIEARRGLDAAQVMSLLAKEIVPQIQNKDRASLFYGVIDRRSFEMQYSLVGSIDGFLQIYNQTQVEELKSSAPALSKEFNFEVRSSSIQLNPRDRFVLATEGLKGSERADGQMWGLNGLKEAVHKAPKQGAHDLRNEILFANEQFTGNQEPVRDQTLLVVEVKDRVIKLASR